jgi:hypothetical protein
MARDETHKMAMRTLSPNSNPAITIEAGTSWANAEQRRHRSRRASARAWTDGACPVDRVVGIEGGPTTTVCVCLPELIVTLPASRSVGYPGAVEAGGFGAVAADGANPRITFLMMVAEGSRDSAYQHEVIRIWRSVGHTRARSAR